MSKSYKIKVNQGPGEAKFVDIPQAGASGKALAVKAVPGGKYQLLDAGTGYAPENIRASRSGKNLQVFFEGRSQPDLIIEDYYEVTPEGFNGLIGESESGRFYEYIPESATANSTVPLLADGSNLVGMALGGAEINASGAAVGTLVAAAGLNPLLLAPLALLGGGGGGGGGGDNGGDAPNNNSAGIKITKATLDTGVSDSDFVTKGPVNEFSGTLSSFTGTPGDKVKLELLDKDGKPLDPVIEGTVTPTQVNGIWSWKWVPVDQDTATNLPEILKDGNYTLKATIVTAAGVAYTHASTTQAVDIDTSSNEGENKDVVLSITSVSADTGTLNNDWVTSDTALVFKGTLSKFSPALGDLVMLTLVPVAEGAATIVQYVTPIQKDNVWAWEWDAQTTPFPEGAYKLTATLVDKAGNVFTTVASVQKELVIDTTGPTDNKGLSIVSMSVDSGVGSFNPLDDSRKDFKTNDNTPVFMGKLDALLPQGERIVVQLMKGNELVETGTATVDSAGKGWTWTPKSDLVDATYQLNAQVVDAAGNHAVKVEGGVTTVIPAATQAVVIDTKGGTDQSDPNKGLKTTKITLSTDTAGEGKTNNDYVTSDGGKKKNGNEDDKLIFTGTLDGEFIENGGKVWVQIIDSTGKVISSAYVEPDSSTSNIWKYENLVPLADGQYVAKSILMDHVGNMISAYDQSFVIDIIPAIFSKSGNESMLNDGSILLKNFAPSMNEYGTYQFGSGDVKVYNGGVLDLGVLKSEYAIGEFQLKFWDQAGNLKVETNEKIWRFENPVTESSETDPAFLGPKNLIDKSIGSVGKIDVDSNFDMASLYDGIGVDDKAASNHVVLSNTTNVILNVSMGDVLALGVTNSFSVADTETARHKGQIQMRIDGQTSDVLNLDGVVNGEKWVWGGGKNSTNSSLGIGSEQYDVYTNTALGVALFVDTDITVNVM